jgi:subtilisin family serine protease
MFSKPLFFRFWRLVAAQSGFVMSAVSLFLALPINARGQMLFTPAGAEFRSDQILVRPKATMSETALARFHAAQRARVLRTFRGLGRLEVVTVPNGETVPGLISKYQMSGLFDFAEPDYVVRAAAAPDDPMYQDGTLWWLNNTGQNGGTPHADIDAPDAWNVLTSASNIVVSVLDTGIRYTHEDLAANMWTNPVDGSYGFNAFTGTNNVNDDNGHGTLVAGMLGAVGNNGKGMAGVVWQVQIMACKCLDSAANGSDSTVIACMDYARTNGARVLNCSFSSTGSSLAVSNEIMALRSAGIILVASCGNGNFFNHQINVDILPNYPACYPMDNIVSVAYTTRTDGLGSFSDYGPTNVDLGAPGDQVSSTYTNSDSAYFISTSGSGISGTSFAAPVVSGACALMLAKYPSENYQQIIARILKATDPVPALAGKCVTGGRLNLYKALSPPINLTASSATNGAPFELLLSTGANRMCVIEASPDLLNWSPLYTNTTDTNGFFTFVDNNSTNLLQRFYRGTAAP